MKNFSWKRCPCWLRLSSRTNVMMFIDIFFFQNEKEVKYTFLVDIIGFFNLLLFSMTERIYTWSEGFFYTTIFIIELNLLFSVLELTYLLTVSSMKYYHGNYRKQIVSTKKKMSLKFHHNFLAIHGPHSGNNLWAWSCVGIAYCHISTMKISSATERNFSKEGVLLYQFLPPFQLNYNS